MCNRFFLQKKIFVNKKKLNSSSMFISLFVVLGIVLLVVFLLDKCSSGFTKCGNDCVNLLTNSEHCGACGNACDPLNETCISGSCTVMS